MVVVNCDGRELAFVVSNIAYIEKLRDGTCCIHTVSGDLFDTEETYDQVIFAINAVLSRTNGR